MHILDVFVNFLSHQSRIYGPGRKESWKNQSMPFNCKWIWLKIPRTIHMDTTHDFLENVSLSSYSFFGIYIKISGGVGGGRGGAARVQGRFTPIWLRSFSHQNILSPPPMSSAPFFLHLKMHERGWHAQKGASEARVTLGLSKLRYFFFGKTVLQCFSLSTY